MRNIGVRSVKRPSVELTYNTYLLLIKMLAQIDGVGTINHFSDEEVACTVFGSILLLNIIDQKPDLIQEFIKHAKKESQKSCLNLVK